MKRGVRRSGSGKEGYEKRVEEGKKKWKNVHMEDNRSNKTNKQNKEIK